MTLSFYLVTSRLMITANVIMKIQNLVVNHKSQPVKSNPDIYAAMLHVSLSFGWLA